MPLLLDFRSLIWQNLKLPINEKNNASNSSSNNSNKNLQCWWQLPLLLQQYRKTSVSEIVLEMELS
jgi:hypothetical protein